MSEAGDALTHVAASLDPITLEDTIAVAGLQTRVDRKYFVPANSCRELGVALQGRVSVLEIDSRRSFAYESVYFDTPEWLIFHAHVQGRRDRFKVRTRTYVDSVTTVLEVKAGGNGAETIKDRHPYEVQDRYQLTDRARKIVEEHLEGSAVVERLETSLVNSYRRATFVDRSDGSRLTCDVDLAFRDGRRSHTGPGSLMVVESKSSGPPTPADRLLWRLGHRPVSLSKYCVGLALIHRHLPANPWNRTLRRGFGWSPERREHFHVRTAR